MSIEKNPLQINIIWHINFKKGKEIAESIFKLLNRDPDEINQHEVGIPVHFNPNSKKINTKFSEKIGIIILIDLEFLNDEDYQKEIENYLDKINTNVFMIPILFEKNIEALRIKQIKKSNIFKLEEEYLNSLVTQLEITDEVEYGKVQEIALSNNILEKLLSELYEEKKLKLFLSHTKRDSFGKKQAIMLKKVIEDCTKTDTFFDVNDIEIGNDIWLEIETEIKEKEVFLVVINTKEYSNSSWCRKEVLCAKKYKRPILEINSLKGKQYRSFPYLGNTKRIILGEDFKKIDFYEIVTEIYLKALRLKYKELLMVKFKEQGEILLNSPEVLDIALNPNMKNIIYYPDPPLPKEEKDLFDVIKKEIKTPLEVLVNENILEGKNAMISISETEPVYTFQIKSFISEIVRYFIAFDLNILYGGSLKYENSPLNLLCQMLKTIEFYKKNEEIDSQKRIINYLAYPLSEMNIKERIKYKHNIEFISCNPNNISSEEAENYLKSIPKDSAIIWDTSLKDMRNRIVNDSNYIIVAGGKLSGFKGEFPGVLEEVCIGIKYKKPIYIIGCYGGVAKEIIKLLLKDKKNNELERYGNEIKCFDEGIKILNNGLSENENKMLFELESSIQIIELILKGMSNIEGENKK